MLMMDFEKRIKAIDPAAVVKCDAAVLDNLHEKLFELHEEQLAIRASAESEGRNFTDEENAKLDEISQEFERTEAEIGRLQDIDEKTARLNARLGRQSEPDDAMDLEALAGKDDADLQPAPQPQAKAKAASISAKSGQSRSKTYRPSGGAAEPARERGKRGFKHFGEFAACVRTASARSGRVDPRLLIDSPSSYGSEGSGADGGFMVPPDFRQQIIEKIYSEQALVTRTDMLTTGSNSMTFPKDETTPWQSSGGVQAYWSGEAKQITTSKPELDEETIRLHKLTALVPVTEELLEDSASLDSYLYRKVPEKMDFAISLALVQGSGSGQPLGLLNSKALISVAKESGQTADTVVYKNITNMWSRMHHPCRMNSVWLVTPDVETQLMQMEFPSTAGAFPVFLPAGGLSASPYATLLGRPIIPTQTTNQLGDKGDIILSDFSQYMTLTKEAGLRIDTSIHLFFDYDLMAFRFIMRIGGQPWWSNAITPRVGSNKLSCFVTLDERA